MALSKYRIARSLSPSAWRERTPFKNSSRPVALVDHPNEDTGRSVAEGGEWRIQSHRLEVLTVTIAQTDSAIFHTNLQLDRYARRRFTERPSPSSAISARINF